VPAVVVERFQQVLHQFGRDDKGGSVSSEKVRNRQTLVVRFEQVEYGNDAPGSRQVYLVVVTGSYGFG